ncbi:MAG: polysaccharide biosynthesis/export family protein [Planctomycetota bacterium]|nr:polysaccharide biosynthesis/export family protein [Planctomycetota bacterium]MDA1177402.1 polysaccharide biosynthesis/export family protein [Planctomycetota bacterium]
MRVRDQLEFVYRLTREESKHSYELNVGDEVRIELLSEKEVDRLLAIQPDGTITVPLLGQIRAARRTVRELQDLLEEQYTKFYKSPNVTVTPIKVNARLEDLRATVDARQGFGGGQSRRAVVMFFAM